VFLILNQCEMILFCNVLSLHKNQYIFMLLIEFKYITNLQTNQHKSTLYVIIKMVCDSLCIGLQSVA